MTFSFPNPDVDRVSLSERVRRLEGRFGPGGGGGLGVGMPDFDQYPENSVSETPEGTIIKISIDDFGNHNVRELSGMGFKFIAFMKWIASWAVYIPIVLCRGHITKQLSSISNNRSNIQTNISINNADIFVDRVCKGFPANVDLQLMPSVGVDVVGFKVPGGVGTVFQTTSLLGKITIKYWYKKNIVIDLMKPTVNSTIYPCYTFGCFTASVMSNPFFPQINQVVVGSNWGLIPFGDRYCAVQLTDLPPYALNVYPRSWCQ